MTGRPGRLTKAEYLPRSDEACGITAPHATPYLPRRADGCLATAADWLERALDATRRAGTRR